MSMTNTMERSPSLPIALNQACVKIPRSAIPRYRRLMQNLRHPTLTYEREKRINMYDKFARGNELVKRRYSAADPDYPVLDYTVITPPRFIFAQNSPSLIKLLTSKPYVEGGPLNLAIVGPIGPRVNACELAMRLAEEAVKRINAVIISGFAPGIDQHAHLGALNYAGRTVAFLPNGLMNERYLNNVPLLRRLMPEYGGGFVSEYYLTESGRPDIENGAEAEQKTMQLIMPDGTTHTADESKMLLKRDGRNTSLADAVVVIEASKRSGSEDTGFRGYLQGIPVFTVDWPRVQLRYERGLPPPINGGLKRLATSGCALSFPLRDNGVASRTPWDEFPAQLFDFILAELNRQKAERTLFLSKFAKRA